MRWLLSPLNTARTATKLAKKFSRVTYLVHMLFTLAFVYQAVVGCLAKGEDLAFQAFHPLVLGRMPVGVVVSDHRLQAALQQFVVDRCVFV